MPCQLEAVLRPRRRCRRGADSSRPRAYPVPPNASLHATETNAKANARRAHVARKHSNPARAVARADATARERCPRADHLAESSRGVAPRGGRCRAFPRPQHRITRYAIRGNFGFAQVAGLWGLRKGLRITRYAKPPRMPVAHGQPTLPKACMMLQIDKTDLFFRLQIDRMSPIWSLQIDKIGHIFGSQIDKPQVTGRFMGLAQSWDIAGYGAITGKAARLSRPRGKA